MYHPTTYETEDIQQSGPRAEAKVAGTFWFYNIGTSTPSARSIGARLQRTSFKAWRSESQSQSTWIFPHCDGPYVLELSSIHPAYPFMIISARDLARFGCCSATAVPGSTWMSESTTAYSQTDRNARYAYL
jgi:hypothetical protein